MGRLPFCVLIDRDHLAGAGSSDRLQHDRRLARRGGGLVCQLHRDAGGEVAERMAGRRIGRRGGLRGAGVAAGHDRWLDRASVLWASQIIVSSHGSMMTSKSAANRSRMASLDGRCSPSSRFFGPLMLVCALLFSGLSTATKIGSCRTY